MDTPASSALLHPRPTEAQAAELRSRANGAELFCADVETRDGILPIVFKAPDEFAYNAHTGSTDQVAGAKAMVAICLLYPDRATVFEPIRAKYPYIFGEIVREITDVGGVQRRVKSSKF